jgi:bifunctional non-homologous end joining protein LigD
MTASTLTLDGKTIETSNRDKVLFPDAGVTKGDLIDYYARIAPDALPHYRGRALTMHRFPDGIAKDGFYQKAIPDYFPDWIDRITLPKEGGEITQVVADTAATLVYLANQGCITPHLALARTQTPDHPDRLVFDLDPSDDDFSKVQVVAKCLRAQLQTRDLPTFVQTTGSRGLHILIPLDATVGFDDVRKAAHAMAEAVVADLPEIATLEHRKSKRGKRVFIDTLRNAYGQTSVAPYALRARPGAPIATPVAWKEALTAGLSPRKYTIRNIFRRLGQTDDPWAGLADATVPASRLN